MRNFQERYSPEDPREAADFFADFGMLVRCIYDVAAEKPHQQLMKCLEAMPIPSILTRKD